MRVWAFAGKVTVPKRLRVKFGVGIWDCVRLALVEVLRGAVRRVKGGLGGESSDMSAMKHMFFRGGGASEGRLSIYSLA